MWNPDPEGPDTILLRILAAHPDAKIRRNDGEWVASGLGYEIHARAAAELEAKMDLL
jgi:hypothetical protein